MQALKHLVSVLFSMGFLMLTLYVVSDPVEAQ